MTSIQNAGASSSSSSSASSSSSTSTIIMFADTVESTSLNSSTAAQTQPDESAPPLDHRMRSLSMRHLNQTSTSRSSLEEIVFTGRYSRPVRKARTGELRTLANEVQSTPTSRPQTSNSLFGDELHNNSTYHTPKKQSLSQPPSAPIFHSEYLHCEQIHICPNANVALLVGQPTSPERVKVLVSSTVLSMASPYFRAVLLPDRFTEGITFALHKYLELHLFDDDPAAVITVCNILHLQSSKIPKLVSGDELADIAIVLDKYDCIDAAWAWTRYWMSSPEVRAELEDPTPPSSDPASDPTTSSTGEGINLMLTKDKELLSKWVFISWVFRDASVFGQCANALSWKMVAGPQSDDEFFLRLPESLQNDLISARLAVITSLHQTTQAFLDRFVDAVCGVGNQHLYYYGKHLPRDCDARVLGTTLKSLREAELYPVGKIAEWGTTASELVGDLRAVGRSIFGANEHHHDTTPGMMFLEGLEGIREGMRRFEMETYVRVSA